MVFSVVIPAYNAAPTLLHALESVLNQTLTDSEIVVVDDASSDETPELMATIKDPRVRYLRQENRGVSAARNAGAHVSRGRYLAFLDSDDEVQPRWLERLGSLLDLPQTGVASCAAEVWPEDASTPSIAYPQPLDIAGRDQHAIFLSHTFAVRREIFWAVGGYDERLRYSENTELGWRLVDYCAANGWQIASVREPLAAYRPARVGGARQLRNAQQTLASYEIILHKHKARLARHPRAYALFSSIAGVAAARGGDMAQARHHFREAVRWDSRNVRHLARFVLTYVPGAREYFWLRHYW